MCDYRPGMLLLSHHENDTWAKSLIEDIRNNRIEHVSIEDELARLLERSHVSYDLPWHIYLLIVPAGQEHWKINYLYGIYFFKTRDPHLSPWRLRPPLNTADTLLIAPNSVLSLEQVQFEPSHTGFKASLGLRPRAHGAGVKIAVVDTGIESSATWPAGRVDLWTAGGTANDTVGHGSAVAEIVHDVAPHAAVEVIKCAASTQLSEWDALAGLHAARDADVINLSWSFGLSTLTCPQCGRQSHSSRSAIFENVLTNTLDRQHEPIVVAAAGNQSMTALRYPARFADVVAIGALDPAGNPAPYSNHGTASAHAGTGHTNVFFAPGGNERCPVMSAHSPLPSKYLYGTSMASAYATGVIAAARGARLDSPPHPPQSPRALLLEDLRRAATALSNPTKYGNGSIQDC